MHSHRFTRLAALLVSSSLALAALAPAQVAPSEGFDIGGALDLSPFCGTFPSFYVFDDSSALVFDGSQIVLISGDGTVLRDYGTAPTSVFSSFLAVDEASGTAFIGESSFGTIRALDLASGQLSDVTTIGFNFDLAFDVVPGLAYVSASPNGFGANEIYRVDLLSGTTTLVAEIGGFSGPVEVDEAGNLFAGALPGTFPIPAGSVDIVRFKAEDLNSGLVLTLNDSSLYSGGFNGLSSTAYDAANGGVVAIETNAGAGGTGSIAWRLDPAGARIEQVATAPGFAGGAQLLDPEGGTVFAGFQPPAASFRMEFSDCFGAGTSSVFNVVPERPRASFLGPGAGVAGPGSVELEGGIPNGFASLWVARSGAYEIIPVIEDIGGLYPVALRADSFDFGRRFAPLPVSSSGTVGFPFSQTPSIEGAILFQWIVMDANMDIVTTSTAVINQE
ncbi:MAG: hypothetical protein AAGB93_10095 [Planctomycetota bacterium]